MLIVAIYPLVIIDFVQNWLAVQNIAPGTYLGGLLICVGFFRFIASGKLLRRVPKAWLIPILIFPIYLLIRIASSNHDFKIVITIGGQVLIALALILLLDNIKKVVIMVYSLIIVSLILSLGQISTYLGISLLASSSKIEGGQYLRISGLARDPNYGALIMIIGFSYALGELIYKEKGKAIFSGACICLALGIGVSLSRVGLITLAIVTIIEISFYFRKKKKVILIVIMLTSTSYIVATGLIENVISQQSARLSKSYILKDPSYYERINIYNEAIDRLLSGDIWIGEGNPDLTFHNTYLDIAVLGGLPALFLYVAFTLGPFIKNLGIAITKRIIKSNIWHLAVSNACASLAWMIMGGTIGVQFEKSPWIIIALNITVYMIYKREQKTLDNNYVKDDYRTSRRRTLAFEA